jgi:uncharacterized protein (DUF1330 family)
MMTTNHKILVAALAGVAIGAIGGGAAVRAAQAKAPAGYVVAQVEVTDAAKFQEYAKAVPSIVASYGGKYLIRGGAITPLEGEAPKRLTVLAFDSVEKAKAFEDSPEYGKARPIRQASAKSTVFIAEGVPAQ